MVGGHPHAWMTSDLLNCVPSYGIAQQRDDSDSIVTLNGKQCVTPKITGHYFSDDLATCSNEGCNYKTDTMISNEKFEKTKECIETPGYNKISCGYPKLADYLESVLSQVANLLDRSAGTSDPTGHTKQTESLNGVLTGNVLLDSLPQPDFIATNPQDSVPDTCFLLTYSFMISNDEKDSKPLVAALSPAATPALRGSIENRHGVSEAAVEAIFASSWPDVNATITATISPASARPYLSEADQLKYLLPISILLMILVGFIATRKAKLTPVGPALTILGEESVAKRDADGELREKLEARAPLRSETHRPDGKKLTYKDKKRRAAAAKEASKKKSSVKNMSRRDKMKYKRERKKKLRKEMMARRAASAAVSQNEPIMDGPARTTTGPPGGV